MWMPLSKRALTDYLPVLGDVGDHRKYQSRQRQSIIITPKRLTLVLYCDGLWYSIFRPDHPICTQLYQCLIFNILTLPETNIAPENRPPSIGKQYSNHPFSGAMLVSGRGMIPYSTLIVELREAGTPQAGLGLVRLLRSATEAWQP